MGLLRTTGTVSRSPNPLSGATLRGCVIGFSREVPCLAPDGSTQTGVFTGEMRLVPVAGEVMRYRSFLRLLVGDRDVESSGPDFFEALREVRRQIEPDGWRILCLGASQDVWPCAGESESSNWRAVCRWKLHDRGRMQRVDIFATGPDVLVGSIEDQERFHAKYQGSVNRNNRLRSLRRKLKLSPGQMAEVLGLADAEIPDLERRDSLPEEVDEALDRLETEGHPALSVWATALREDGRARRHYPMSEAAYRFVPASVGVAVPTYIATLIPVGPGDLSWLVPLGVFLLLVVRRGLAPSCEDCGERVVPKDRSCPACAASFLPGRAT